MSQECVYGYPCVVDPNDFSPDAECCSPAEIAAHKAACAAYGTAAYQPNKGCCTGVDVNGSWKHVARTSWGIGVNVLMRCDECGAIDTQVVHCWDCGGDFCCASCWPKHDAEETC